MMERETFWMILGMRNLADGVLGGKACRRAQKSLLLEDVSGKKQENAKG